MLRFERRWHDAANSPLLREARLLWFATPPNPSVPTPPDDESESAETTPQTGQPEGAETPRERDDVLVEQKLMRRQAEQTLLGAIAPSEEPPKAADVLARVQSLHKKLQSMKGTVDSMKESVERIEDKHGHAPRAEVEFSEGIVDGLWNGVESVALPLQDLKLEKWEKGEMTPYEFLHHLGAYNDKMDALDLEQLQQEERNTLNWNARFTPAQCEKRKEARKYLYDQAKKAVEDCKKRKPENFSEEQIQQLQPLTPKQIWDLYTEAEKQDIIKTVSKAAGTDVLKLNAEERVQEISEGVEKRQPRSEKTIEETLLKLQRTLVELENKAGHEQHSEEHGDGTHPSITDIWDSVQSAIQNVNKAAGIEWMTLYELKAAFTEVVESIKEVRKRKSAGRIARAALMIGRVASYIPGTGGSDLVNVLDELLDHKNTEIKDAYKKELGNAREDLGFRDLFIGGSGGTSRMQYYMNLGDTNRTRAILEFAADKALLYGIEDKTPDTFMIPPGRYSLRDVLPPEWSDHQVMSYFDNLRFQNNQGQKKQVEAGENMVKGRDSLAGYLDPFKAILNGMSLWLAKGIAEAALKKIKKGEMSASLTLIVLDAWEHNELFRKYVPTEWLARFSGDHKQLLVGMLKYDQGHLIAGAQEPGQETHDLATARVKARPGEEAPEPRIGPYVVAVRNYVRKKDSSLESRDPQEFFSVVAKLLASQTIKLKNGKILTVYSPELMPYHIKYKPDEMRDANVEALGDDNFVERSEIINSTAEVMKAIGAVDQNGFRFNMKGRYFFSQIIDNYTELVKQSNELRAKGRADEANELLAASENFRNKLNPQIDQWFEEAVNAGGASKLLKIKHKDQGSRYLILTLLKEGLLSMDKVQELAEKKKAAQELLEQYQGTTQRSQRNSGAGGGSQSSNPATAA